GANWRTFARQITAARPGWGALLLDLRLHGDSGSTPPPHTLAAAAADVADALAELPVATRAVLGHSFGGKVAIELARQLGDGGGLEHLFVVDAAPGKTPERGPAAGPPKADGARAGVAVQDIIDLLARLPPELPDRKAFTAWVEGHGVSRPIAMWLAMNV